MTKAEIVRRIARSERVQILEAEKYFNSVIGTITDTLAEGEDVNIRGFGKFFVFQTKGKAHARNPKTGKLHPVPPRRTPKFKAGKPLKAKCNG